MLFDVADPGGACHRHEDFTRRRANPHRMVEPEAAAVPETADEGDDEAAQVQ
jgi:hypothetical protein